LCNKAASGYNTAIGLDTLIGNTVSTIWFAGRGSGKSESGRITRNPGGKIGSVRYEAVDAMRAVTSLSKDRVVFVVG